MKDKFKEVVEVIGGFLFMGLLLAYVVTILGVTFGLIP